MTHCPYGITVHLRITQPPDEWSSPHTGGLDSQSVQRLTELQPYDPKSHYPNGGRKILSLKDLITRDQTGGEGLPGSRNDRPGTGGENDLVCLNGDATDL